MATIESFNRSELKKSNPLLTKFRTTVETAFYGKNMQEVTDMTEAYNLALNAKGVIVTDLPVLHTEELGLPNDAKVLVENGGRIIGRTARAKRIIGENKEEDEKLQAIIMDVIYQNRLRHYYKATGYVGLDKDFIIKAHIAFPEGNENKSLLLAVELPVGQSGISGDVCTVEAVQRRRYLYLHRSRLAPSRLSARCGCVRA